MIDVESIRRNFNIGTYDATLGAQLPFGMSSGAPLMDNHRALVHWNHNMSQTPPATKPHADCPKSDEDEDDDDEDRPFTPPPPRERLSYTKYQLELLNAIYKEVRYPNSTQKQLIAKRVGITREQVKIWFQNRRRKDVIGNSTKSKSCETSPGSTCSSDSKDSEQRNSPSPDSAENSSSEETSQTNDSDEKVVPNVVLKSVINELLKFVNDPLKGKRKKKRSKAKKDKEKTDIKKGLAQTLLSGGYDMISPPNQITPTAFFDKAKRGFNHAIGGSAFANPRESQKPAQISSISSTSDSSSTNSSKSSETVNSNSRHGNHMPFNQFPFQLPRQPGHMFGNAHTSSLPPLGTTSGCEIPVLSDLLSYKSSLDARHKEIMSAANPHFPTVLPPPQHHQIPRPDFEKNFPHGISSFPHSRPLNGIFPFPFMAEHPVLLSSLRQPDQLLRPAPQYPTSSIGEDPYQPLLVTSLSNPYFSPPSTSWSGQTLQNTATYTQL